MSRTNPCLVQGSHYRRLPGRHPYRHYHCCHRRAVVTDRGGGLSAAAVTGWNDGLANVATIAATTATSFKKDALANTAIGCTAVSILIFATASVAPAATAATGWRDGLATPAKSGRSDGSADAAIAAADPVNTAVATAGVNPVFGTSGYAAATIGCTAVSPIALAAAAAAAATIVVVDDGRTILDHVDTSDAGRGPSVWAVLAAPTVRDPAALAATVDAFIAPLSGPEGAEDPCPVATSETSPSPPRPPVAAWVALFDSQRRGQSTDEIKKICTVCYEAVSDPQVPLNRCRYSLYQLCFATLRGRAQADFQ